MSQPTRRRGLKYGQVMLIMLALILLLVGLAYWRQSSLGPAPGFDDVPFSLMQNAIYDQTQADSVTLAQQKAVTPKSQGSLIFVKTNAGNYAKLSAEFNFCLIDPQNIKFWIHQGALYSPEGEPIRRLDNFCVDLTDRFDLDTGLAESQGAREGSADLYFENRGPALQVAYVLSGAGLALPSVGQLRP